MPVLSLGLGLVGLQSHQSGRDPCTHIDDPLSRENDGEGQVISTLVKNFSEGNDFFRVLLRVFQEVRYLSSLGFFFCISCSCMNEFLSTLLSLHPTSEAFHTCCIPQPAPTACGSLTFCSTHTGATVVAAPQAPGRLLPHRARPVRGLRRRLHPRQGRQDTALYVVGKGKSLHIGKRDRKSSLILPLPPLPPLCPQDLMHKPNRRGVEAYYTDDGFAMGVAYILAILDQGAKFDSLHWFEAVDSKLRADEAALAERQGRAQAERHRREAGLSRSGSGGGWFGSRGKATSVDLDSPENDEVRGRGLVMGEAEGWGDILRPYGWE